MPLPFLGGGAQPTEAPTTLTTRRWSLTDQRDRIMGHICRSHTGDGAGGVAGLP